MARQRAAGLGILWIVVVGFVAALLGCSPSPATPPPEVAALQRQVAAQGTRVAVLETRVAAAQRATGAPTVTARPTVPTPTIIPPVSGLPSEGTAKGAAAAKVTLTEYTNYF